MPRIRLAVPVLLALCAGGPVGAAGTAHETRQVGHFSHVVLESIGDLDIRQGEETSLMVEAEPRLLPNIKSATVNGILQLGVHEGSISTRQPVRFHLTVTSLASLETRGSGNVVAGSISGDRLAVRLAGSGDIQLQQLDTGLLEVYLEGAGDVSASGRTKRQRVIVDGAGDYQALDLDSETAWVALHGSGDALVNVSAHLDTEIDGSGTLRYTGDATINSRDTSTAFIEKLHPDSLAIHNNE